MAETCKLAKVPTLAEVVAEPARAAALPREVLAGLRGELARIDALLFCYLVDGKSQGNGAIADDRLLDVSEAASKLGLSQDYLYRNHRRFTFTRKIGRRLLFSLQGLERYIRGR